MMRYMAIQAIKLDPAWMNGEYKTEPVEGMRTANELLLVMGSSPLQMQKAAPTRELAEQYVDRYLERTMAGTDANNMIFYITRAGITIPARTWSASPRRFCGSTPPTITSIRRNSASRRRWSSACRMRASF